MLYRSLITATALAFSFIAMLAPAQANSPAAMESEYRDLQTRSHELGGSNSPRQSIRNLNDKINNMSQHIARLEDLAPVVEGDIADLKAAHKQESERDATSETCLDEKLATEILRKILKKITGPIVEQVVEGIEQLAAEVVKQGNLDMLEELIKNETIKAEEMQDLIAALKCVRAADTARIRDLEAIKRQMTALFGAIAQAKETARLNSQPATGNAQTTRATDDEGDEKLRQEQELDGVRSVNPSKKPKPQGVRPSTQQNRKIAKAIAITAVTLLVKGDKTEKRRKTCSHNLGKEKGGMSMISKRGKNKLKIKNIAKIGLNLF